jgi:hypothetical protein
VPTEQAPLVTDTRVATMIAKLRCVVAAEFFRRAALEHRLHAWAGVKILLLKYRRRVDDKDAAQCDGSTA